MNPIRQFFHGIGERAGLMQSAITAHAKRAGVWANGLSNRELGMLAAASLGAAMVIAVGAFTGGTGSSLAGLVGQGVSDDPALSDDPGDSGTASEDSPADDSSGGLPPPAEDKTVTTPTESGPTSPSTTPTPTPVPTPTDPGDETPDPDPTPEPPTGPEPEAGRIKHVWVVNLSSPGYEATFAEDSQMPYLAETLRPKGELLSNYSLLDESALPNYIAAISGQPPNKLTKGNCSTYRWYPASAKPDKKGVVSGPGCVYPDSALTIADQFTVASFSWRGYHEDMVNKFGPANCAHPDNNGPDESVKGGYAASRNPFIYFHSLVEYGDCALNDGVLTNLEKDLKKAKTTPAFSFIAPNLCNAGVPGQCADDEPDGPAAADAFLETYVPKILKSPAYKKDGLIVITFGEVHPSADEPKSERVGTVLLSPFVSTNMTTKTKLDPYSLLKTLQDLFGFEYLANAGLKSTKSFSAPLLGNVGDG